MVVTPTPATMLSVAAARRLAMKQVSRLLDHAFSTEWVGQAVKPTNTAAVRCAFQCAQTHLNGTVPQLCGRLLRMGSGCSGVVDVRVVV